MKASEINDEEEKSLIMLSSARQAIEKAKDIWEVKSIRDKAEAVRIYAKQSGRSLEIQNHAAEIKLRAERKAGELLAGMEGFGRGRKSTTVVDFGITHNESSRWQKESIVPEERFEEYVRSPGKTNEVTTHGLLKIATELKAKEKKESEKVINPPEGLVTSANDVRGKFNCIYADPPWNYDQESGCEGAVASQYKTMTVEQLCKLKVCDVPVWDLCASGGCHLWMWTTWPKIRDGVPHKILNAWGFRWVGEVVWIKPGLGVGRWLRPSTEILILAEKGGRKLLHKDQRGDFSTDKRMRHSQKPDQAYEIIERLSSGPKIELFARRARAGWCRWGNEA